MGFLDTSGKSILGVLKNKKKQGNESLTKKQDEFKEAATFKLNNLKKESQEAVEGKVDEISKEVDAKQEAVKQGTNKSLRNFLGSIGLRKKKDEQSGTTIPKLAQTSGTEKLRSKQPIKAASKFPLALFYQEADKDVPMLNALLAFCFTVGVFITMLLLYWSQTRRRR